MSANTRKHIRRKQNVLSPGQLICRAGKWEQDLRNESDRGCALVTAEMLSEALESLIASRFVEAPAVCKRMLSEGMAPLGSIAARVNIALLLGLIGKEVHDVLHRIRTIRNVFAHEPTGLDFASREISEVCHGLPCGSDSGPMPRRRMTKRACAARRKFMSAANYCMSAIMTERWNVNRLSASITATSFSDTIDPASHVPNVSHHVARPAKKKRSKVATQIKGRSAKPHRVKSAK